MDYVVIQPQVLWIIPGQYDLLQFLWSFAPLHSGHARKESITNKFRTILNPISPDQEHSKKGVPGRRIGKEVPVQGEVREALPAYLFFHASYMVRGPAVLFPAEKRDIAIRFRDSYCAGAIPPAGRYTGR